MTRTRREATSPPGSPSPPDPPSIMSAQGTGRAHARRGGLQFLVLLVNLVKLE